MKTHIEANIIMHHVEVVSADSYCDQPSDLGEFDARDLARQGIVEAWYWYRRDGGYEGDGELIGRMADGKWSLLYLSHCSCNGPCENSGSTFASLDELAAFPYSERGHRATEILAAARAKAAA